jgi:hypothetical protein
MQAKLSGSDERTSLQDKLFQIVRRAVWEACER